MNLVLFDYISPLALKSTHAYLRLHVSASLEQMGDTLGSGREGCLPSEKKPIPLTLRPLHLTELHEAACFLLTD